MNKLFLSLLSITLLFSCTLTQEPDFVKMDNYQILTINKNDVKLQANAYFKNPNDVGCEVVDTEIKVFVNDLYISDVKQANLIELEAKNEFFVPLKVSIPLNKISKDKSGMLGGMLSVLTNKNVKIKYEGFVTIRKAGIPYDIEVLGEEVIKEFKKL